MQPKSLLSAGCYAEPYPLTARSKAALVDNLALMLEQRKITIPRDTLCPMLVEELESFQFTVSEATGTIRTGSPHGYHDDCVIALALAAWQLREDDTKLELLWMDLWESF